MERKILILGGGLAGLCMGVQFQRRNIPFEIWTSDSIPCASEKAAGLMNPVVVKRLLKTWLADDVIPYNQAFYPELEKLTNTKFYSQLPVYRMFNNELVQGEWKMRVNDGSMESFMGEEIYSYAPDKLVDSGFQGADIHKAAMVDCGIFISALRNYFAEKNCLKNASFDYSEIKKVEGFYYVNGERYSDIIFCEGMNATNNPWFGKLPFVPTKGELLYVDIPDLPREKEIMKGVFLAPLQKGGFVCGSTYEWQFENDKPSEIGFEKINNGLREITHLPVEIKQHTAGVRPASRDRRPYVGEHPTMKNMFVLNGLGTKGYMLAPFLSERLADLILQQIPLDREMDIKRLKTEL